MKTINHDGEEYVLKTDIENAFRDRIQKLSARAIQAEEAAAAIQDQLDNQSGELSKIQKLSEKVKSLESELETANSRYSRHTAMSELGITDPEVRELVEWQYERATKGDDKAPSLNDWLKSIKEDPSKAPVTLRPHLESKQPTAAEQVTEQVTEQAAPQVTPQVEQPALIAPKTNTGAAPAPVQSTDILKRGAEDFEFYKANRDAIRKAYRGKK